MSAGLVAYGAGLQVVQEQATVALNAFPVNLTNTLYAFTVPVGFGPVRIVKVSWVSRASLSDADGTMLVSVIARDVSEGADDTLVNAQSVEGGVANAIADFTLATEGAEKEFTLDEGDSVLVTFTGNSAAIDTNGAIAVTVHYHPVPDEGPGVDVKHASFYR
jgi:hypothetical protein